MTDWLWKKLNWISSGLALLTLFGYLIFSANIEIKDADLWLHLATGKYILQNFYIPKVDILSAVIAGQDWINHEWLFQVIVAASYQLAGFDGLITLQVVVVGLTFVLLLRLGQNPGRQVFTTFLLLLILFVYQHRLTIRPDIFSLLFLTLYIQTLSQNLDRKISLFILFILQVLWTNIHGFFILGPLIVMTVLAGEWTKRHVPLPWEWNKVGRLEDKEYTNLKLALGVIILACFFNPHTFKGVWYPLSILFSVSGDSKIFFQSIVELQNPLKLNTLFSWHVFPYYKSLIILSAGSFVLNRRKIDIGMFFFWVMFLLFSLNAVRNVVFFSFAAYFAILTNSAMLPFDKYSIPRLIKKTGPIVINALFILWIAQNMERDVVKGYFDFDKYERKSEYGGVSQRNFPYKAADFLVEHKISGDFFNDFNSGAYLLGRTFPNIKVFIDGRTEAYGIKHFEKYRKIWMEGDTELFDKVSEEYNLTGAFLNSVYAPVSKKLIKHLYDQSDWILIYFDFDATIFLRDVPRNQPWIKALAINFEQWSPQKIDLLKIGLRRVNPYRSVFRAYGLYNMGFTDKAKQELLQALRVTEALPKAQKLLGKIYFEEENFLLAYEHLRKAKLLDPYDKKVRGLLEKIRDKLER